MINNGEIILIENKAELMRKLGKKQLTLQLHMPFPASPGELSKYQLCVAPGGRELVYTYDTQEEHSSIPELLRDLNAAGIELKDLHTTQSSLEEIFVGLVRQGR